MASSSNVGSLNVKLVLSTDQFTAAMDTVTKKTAAGAAAINTASMRNASTVAMRARGGGASNKMAGSAFQNLGFGLDDFIQQTEAQGLQAGLRAVGNNLTALAGAFGPVAIVATAAGVAIGSQFLKAIDRGEEHIERFAKTLSNLHSRIKDIQTVSAEARDIGGIGDFGAAMAKSKELDSMRAEEKKIQETVIQTRAAAAKEQTAMAEALEGKSGIGGVNLAMMMNPDLAKRYRNAVGLVADSDIAIKESLDREMAILRQKKLLNSPENRNRFLESLPGGSRKDTDLDRLMKEKEQIDFAQARGLITFGDASRRTQKLDAEYDRALRSRGDQFREAFETPAERVARMEREANESFGRNEINADERDKYIRRARNSLKTENRIAPLLERGTVDQQSFINRTLRGDTSTEEKTEHNTASTATNTGAANLALNRIERKLPTDPVVIVDFA